ncbi:MAG: thioredoxin domain-containing protein [Nitrospinota bacterium]|nr:thioredoxin domain-containing protein [Nitrospinota bacterium]
MQTPWYVLFFTILFLFAAAAPSQADGFFKWVDEKGETHYSDSQSGAPAGVKNTQERSFDDIEYNVTPPVEYSPSPFGVLDRKQPREKRKSNRSKASAGSLPWFTQNNFDYEVLRSGRLTLVEFWAVWCGVCRKVDPVINDLAVEFGSKVKIGRVDIDEEELLQRKYKVSGVPNLVFFKNGKVVGRMIGRHSRDSYEKMIKRLI